MSGQKLIKNIVDKKKNNQHKALYRVEWTDGSYSWEKVDALIGVYDELVRFEIEKDKQKKQKWVVQRQSVPKKVYKMSVQKNQRKKKQQQIPIINTNKQKYTDEQKNADILKNRMKNKEKRAKNKHQRTRLRKQRQEALEEYYQIELEEECKCNNTRNGAKQRCPEKVDQDFINYSDKQKQILKRKFRNLLIQLPNSINNEHNIKQKKNIIQNSNYKQKQTKRQIKQINVQKNLIILSYQFPSSLNQTLKQIASQNKNISSISNQNSKNINQQSPYRQSMYQKDLQNADELNNMQNEDLYCEILKDCPNKIIDSDQRVIRQIFQILKIQGQFMGYVEWQLNNKEDANASGNKAKQSEYGWVHRDIIRYLNPQILLKFYEDMHRNMKTWKGFYQNQKQAKKHKNRYTHKTNQQFNPVQIIINEISSEQEQGPTIAFK